MLFLGTHALGFSLWTIMLSTKEDSFIKLSNLYALILFALLHWLEPLVMNVTSLLCPQPWKKGFSLPT